MTRPLISIAIPAFNESDNIPELLKRLTNVLIGLKDRYTHEIVICENGSADDTLNVLQAHQATIPGLRIVRLSRNFHMEGGMMAALSHVHGDLCIIMSADLQDPPELIPQMIEKWESGLDHVYTVITYRHGESWFRRQAAAVFYWLIDRISDTPVPRNSSDFRLVDRQMYEAFNSLPEKYRMVRATWGWLGFSSVGIEYERPPRTKGKSSFNPFVTAGFAVRGMLASSLTPLKIIPIFGLSLSLLSFLGLIYSMLRALFFGVPFAGFGTLISVVFLMFGLLFLMLSVLAEYTGMIYLEARARPAFIEKRDRSIGPREAE